MTGLWRSLVMFVVLAASSAATAIAATDAGRLHVLDGYRVSLYAEGLGKARLMQLTPSGDILLTSPNHKVLRVRSDKDGDGRSDGTEVLIDGLKRVHGISLDGDTLYLAEERRVLSVAYDQTASKIASEPKVILDGLPGGAGHSTRTVKKGPDGKLYVSIGSSCNVCEEREPFRASLIRFTPGETPEIVATGLRNTVGFDWQPGTNALYGVDNGRDWLGDDFPPCELNRIEQGKFYGWPYFNGDNRPDPDVGARASAQGRDPVPPVHGFGAHVAPLSIRFLQHQADAAMNGRALVAEHGSWNRSKLAGYQVVMLTFEGERVTEVPFLWGFQEGANVMGRPVDVIEAGDGTIYVSDDKAGVIWKVERAG